MLLALPDGSQVSGTEVLLHACCAPCSSSVIECMLQNGMRPTVFFCNPNIYPFKEYEIRKEELKRFLREGNVPYFDEEYNHEEWLAKVHGYESEPERGKRCEKCFLFRMLRTAEYAAKHNFRWFTTTLSSSRWKDYNQIVEAGRSAAAVYSGVSFWEQNWRKGGLQQRRAELLREKQFYNQLYCGCEYSLDSAIKKQKR